MIKLIWKLCPKYGLKSANQNGGVYFIYTIFVFSYKCIFFDK